jgi:hypothetical protein
VKEYQMKKKAAPKSDKVPIKNLDKFPRKSFGDLYVYARCRPLNQKEIEKACKSIVEIQDETSMKLLGSQGGVRNDF